MNGDDKKKRKKKSLFDISPPEPPRSQTFREAVGPEVFDEGQRRMQFENELAMALAQKQFMESGGLRPTGKLPPPQEPPAFRVDPVEQATIEATTPYRLHRDPKRVGFNDVTDVFAPDALESALTAGNLRATPTPQQQEIEAEKARAVEHTMTPAEDLRRTVKAVRDFPTKTAIPGALKGGVDFLEDVGGAGQFVHKGVQIAADVLSKGTFGASDALGGSLEGGAKSLVENFRPEYEETVKGLKFGADKAKELAKPATAWATRELAKQAQGGDGKETLREKVLRTGLYAAAGLMRAKTIGAVAGAAAGLLSPDKETVAAVAAEKFAKLGGMTEEELTSYYEDTLGMERPELTLVDHLLAFDIPVGMFAWQLIGPKSWSNTARAAAANGAYETVFGTFPDDDRSTLERGLTGLVATPVVMGGFKVGGALLGAGYDVAKSATAKVAFQAATDAVFRANGLVPPGAASVQQLVQQAGMVSEEVMSAALRAGWLASFKAHGLEAPQAELALQQVTERFQVLGEDVNMVRRSSPALDEMMRAMDVADRQGNEGASAKIKEDIVFLVNETSPRTDAGAKIGKAAAAVDRLFGGVGVRVGGGFSLQRAGIGAAVGAAAIPTADYDEPDRGDDTKFALTLPILTGLLAGSISPSSLGRVDLIPLIGLIRSQRRFLSSGDVAPHWKRLIKDTEIAGLADGILDEPGDLMRDIPWLDRAVLRRRVYDAGALSREHATEPQRIPTHARKILDIHNGSVEHMGGSEGGATYSLYGGDMLGKKGAGWAVGVGRIEDGTQVAVDGHPTPEALEDFARKNWQWLKDPRLHMGTWFNDGQTTIELGVRIADDAHAEGMGNKYSQKALFHLERFEGKELAGDSNPVFGMEEVLKDLNTPGRVIGIGNQVPARTVMEALEQTGRIKFGDMSSDEFIVAAAVKRADTGEVFWGNNHTEARFKAADNRHYDLLPDDERIKIFGEDPDDLSGYLDNKGNYHGGRNNAAEIALAQRQLTAEGDKAVRDTGWLDSQDLLNIGIPILGAGALAYAVQEDGTLNERLLASALLATYRGPRIARDMTILGAGIINAGERSFGKWAPHMRKLFGGQIEKDLDELYRISFIRAMNTPQMKVLERMGKGEVETPGLRGFKRLLKEDPRPSLFNASEQQRAARALRVGLPEVVDAVIHFGDARVWYDRDVIRFEDLTRMIIPETKDPLNMDIFKFILAIESGGTAVLPEGDRPGNFKIAEAVFKRYLKTGKLDPRNAKPQGMYWDSHQKQYRKFQEKATELGGIRNALDWLLEKQPRGRGDTARETYNAIEGLGDWIKVGRFHLNLNGIHDEGTIDQWMFRTWQRWQGYVTETPAQRKMVDPVTGKKVWSTAVHESGVPVMDLEKNVPKDVNKEMRAVLARMSDKSEEIFGVKLEVADIQALLWYHEKKLSELAGGMPSEAYTFADAAAVNALGSNTLRKLAPLTDGDYVPRPGGPDLHAAPRGIGSAGEAEAGGSSALVREGTGSAEGGDVVGVRGFRGEYGDNISDNPFENVRAWRATPSYTTDREIAELYAKGPDGKTTGKIREDVLDIKKPFELGSKGTPGKRATTAGDLAEWLGGSNEFYEAMSKVRGGWRYADEAGNQITISHPNDLMVHPEAIADNWAIADNFLITMAAMANGYDGFHYIGSYTGAGPLRSVEEWRPFRASQIKAAGGLALAAGVYLAGGDDNELAAAALVPAFTGRPRFSSRMAEVVGRLPAKTTGAQFLKKILAQAPKAEREWNKPLLDFLEANRGKSVTLEEVMSRWKPIVLDEVRYGYDTKKVPLAAKIENYGTERHPIWTVTNHEGKSLGQYGANRAEAERHLANVADMEVVAGARTKWGGDQWGYLRTPGGTNYREAVITMPPPGEGPSVEQLVFKQGYATKEELQAAIAGDPMLVDSFTALKPGLKIVNTGDLDMGGGGWNIHDTRPSGFGGPRRATFGAYTSIHWGNVENPVLHLRMQDIEIDGKKWLLVDELQSDWQQRGRKKGFKTGDRLIDGHDYDWWRRRAEELFGGGRADPSPSPVGTAERRREEWAIAVRNRDALADKPDEVPDMPFKESYDIVGLGMKRVMDEAVDGEYHGIMWTSGEAQRIRNDKVIADNLTELSWNRNTDKSTGKVFYNFWDETGNSLASGVHEDDLVDYVGKNIAKKVRAADEGMINGDDLTIGGHGLKTYYDGMIPDWVEGFGKKNGAPLKVERYGEFNTKPADGELNDAPSWWWDIDSAHYDDEVGHALHPDPDVVLGELIGKYKGPVNTGSRDYAAMAQWASGDGDAGQLWNSLSKEAREAFGGTPEQLDLNPYPGFEITPKLREVIEKGLPILGLGAMVAGQDDDLKGKNPEMLTALGLMAWMKKPKTKGAMARAVTRDLLDNVAFGGKGETRKLRDVVKRAYISTVNEFAPFRDVLEARAGYEGKFKPRGLVKRAVREQLGLPPEPVDVSKVDPFDDPELMARASQGWAQYAQDILENGLHAPGTIDYRTRGLFPIYGEIEAAGKMDDLRRFRLAMSGRELAAQNRLSGYTDADLAEMDQVIATLSKDADIVRWHQELKDYHFKWMELLEEEGLFKPLSKADAKKFGSVAERVRAGRQEFTPWIHEVVPPKKEAGVGGRSLIKVPKAVKGMSKEGGRVGKIVDPTESDVRYTASYTNIMMRHRVQKALGSLADDFPDNPFVQKIPHQESLKVTMFDKAQLKGYVDDEVIDNIDGDLLTVFGKKSLISEHKLADQIFALNDRDGKRVMYRVTDPFLLEAMTGLRPEQMGPILKLLSLPATVLRAGVTLAPDFALANLIRDTMQAAIASDRKGVVGMNVVNAFSDGLRGLAIAMAGGIDNPVKRIGGAAAHGAAMGYFATTGDLTDKKRLAGAGVGAGLLGGFAAASPKIAMHGLLGRAKGAKLSAKQWISLWSASGGGQAAHISMDRRYIAEAIRRATKRDGKPIARSFRHAFEALQAVGEGYENATRFGEFARGMGQEGMDPRTAMKVGYETRDISIDFKRHGSSQIVTALRPMAAFWNARIQGFDKTRRIIMDKPGRAFGTLLTTITAPSLALYYMNRDVREYWEEPQWERNMFWLVPLGLSEPDAEGYRHAENGFIRIPKPFELGLLFGSFFERFAEMHDPMNPYGGALDSTGNSAIMSFVKSMGEMFLPMPTVLTPMVENALDYDLFRQRRMHSPFEPESMRPELRGRDRSSATAALLSDKLNALERAPWTKGFASWLGMTPVEIDNYISDYTGSLGKYAVGASDKIIRSDKGVDLMPGKREFRTNPMNPEMGPKPAARRDRATFAGRFFADVPAESSEGMNRFWQVMDATKGAEANLKAAEKYFMGDMDRLVEIVNDEQFKAELGPDVQSVADELSELRSYRAFVERGSGTPAEKREELDGITQMENDLVSQVLELMRPVMESISQEKGK